MRRGRGHQERRHGGDQPRCDCGFAAERARLESLVAEAPLAALGPTPDTIGFRGSPSSDVAVVDGLDASDGYFLNKADPLRAFPAEAVDSVQVTASTAPLEYKATGGIANAATRTGTEDFHGEVYGFYRNSSFASPDRYDPGFRPDDKQETEEGTWAARLWNGCIIS